MTGILFLSFSLIVFVARFLSERNVPFSEKLTTQAWDALGRNDYATAISKADDCIKFFNKLGDEHEKDVLNNVAACFLVRGEAAEKLGHMNEAIDAYTETMRYEFARIYDPRGRFFWSPAAVAADHLAALRPGVEIVYPLDGQRVDRRIEVHGKKQGLSADREVWVFVKSAKTDYYPYPTSSSDPSGEKWQAEVCVGQPESSETEFTISACPVEPQARGILLEDHRLPCEKSLRQLPSTIQMSECSKRTVYLEPPTSPPIERK
ncbi:MAG TPA: hypothetical protein VNY51_05940 [Candidatus Dormibacteraeota bacterium]|nr:hypothetical protein [Candidatus Dormibacteraeota bacterium]